MPSETKAVPAADPADAASRALAALAPAAGRWRSAVVAAAEEVRGMLGDPGTPDAAGHALGAFADGRIDAARFAGIVTRSRPVDAATLVRLRVAHETLRALAERPLADLLVADVPPGGSVRASADAALAEIGRAFGAAHEAALARQGAFREAEHGTMHAGFPFAAWSARERDLAPPLLLSVDGVVLDPAGLLPFLDGAVRIALIVRGPCAPAPLVRLVTPGTFVLQTDDAAALARLAAAPGPAVAAVVPDGAAHFVHDPSAGRAPWERLQVARTPSEPPRRAIGRWSAAQQAEELRQLAALAMRPSDVALAGAAAAAAPQGAPADPAGLLAAWLLDAASPAAGPGARGHG